MFKSSIGVVFLLIFLSSGIPFVVGSEEGPTMDAIWIPVGRLVIAPPVGVVPKRSAVPFPHSRHFNYSCETCHHQWDRYSEPLSCTTAGCHDLKQPPAKALKNGKLTAEGIRYFAHAYHTLCRNCHREINDRNRERAGSRLLRAGNQDLMPNGPISCSGCHPK